MILLLALLLLTSPAQPSSAATEPWLGRAAELALATFAVYLESGRGLPVPGARR